MSIKAKFVLFFAVISIVALESCAEKAKETDIIQTQYRVSWYEKSDSTNKGFGEWSSDSALIKIFVDWGNSNLPDIYHFLEKKQSKCKIK